MKTDAGFCYATGTRTTSADGRSTNGTAQPATASARDAARNATTRAEQMRTTRRMVFMPGLPSMEFSMRSSRTLDPKKNSWPRAHPRAMANCFFWFKTMRFHSPRSCHAKLHTQAQAETETRLRGRNGAKTASKLPRRRSRPKTPGCTRSPPVAGLRGLRLLCTHHHRDGSFSTRLVGRAGVGPATHGLKVRCSTN